MELYHNTKLGFQSIPSVARRQACVVAINQARLSSEIRLEMINFISRNMLPDCGKVPPNCLKAHLIKTAKRFGLSKSKINSLKKLFKSKIGFNGYYLDKGKLRKI